MASSPPVAGGGAPAAPTPAAEVVTQRGGAGNVVAAIASFLLPGLGQLAQGRILSALLFFCASVFMWFFLLGWVIHLAAAVDAAIWSPTRRAPASAKSNDFIDSFTGERIGPD
jgi:TM2 domain-containing membrane protein YozV